MWKNTVQRIRPRIAIWRMRIACWIPKATNTHPEYVIFIAFLLQQWLRERPSVLRRSTLPVFSCYYEHSYFCARHYHFLSCPATRTV
jgi:hypothetical protein